jgi:NADPH:quinone reductase-like Zn-dependent oxidoreductase
MKATQVRTVGGPEVLQLRDVPDPVPQSWKGRSSRFTRAG